MVYEFKSGTQNFSKNNIFIRIHICKIYLYVAIYVITFLFIGVYLRKLLVVGDFNRIYNFQ